MKEEKMWDEKVVIRLYFFALSLWNAICHSPVAF